MTESILQFTLWVRHCDLRWWRVMCYLKIKENKDYVTRLDFMFLSKCWLDIEPISSVSSVSDVIPADSRRWINVRLTLAVLPTLNQYWLNVLCLLGSVWHRPRPRSYSKSTPVVLLYWGVVFWGHDALSQSWVNVGNAVYDVGTNIDPTLAQCLVFAGVAIYRCTYDR